MKLSWKKQKGVEYLLKFVVIERLERRFHTQEKSMVTKCGMLAVNYKVASKNEEFCPN
jgi:hypothetical protein